MPYINTETLQYPVTESEIRTAFPNTSFPAIFTPPEPYAVVFPAPAPAYNIITHFAHEVVPVLTAKGHYEQQWEIVPLPTPADIAPAVPLAISLRQARRALFQRGLLDEVEAVIANAPREVQIDWESASEIRRDWSTLLQMQTILGWTDQQLDDLFVLGDTL